MTFVVTEACIRCKYTDCVDVCPVDAFREGPNFLVIDPDECIDCADTSWVCLGQCDKRPHGAVHVLDGCRGAVHSSSASNAASDVRERSQGGSNTKSMSTSATRGVLIRDAAVRRRSAGPGPA